MQTLPLLPPLEVFRPTRDYLQDVAKVLGKFQQAFLPVDAHDWQRGLVVNMRGLSTQTFHAANQETRASIDLVKHKLRLAGSKWLLEDYDAHEMMNNLRSWLESRGLAVHLEEPVFAAGKTRYDAKQAEAYARALWWMDRHFRELQPELTGGLVSPVLLYPHHFDLSLTWYPFGDERQLNLGWSTGDETIAEPYVYLTAYPELPGFMNLPLSSLARWQHEGFSGAVMRYQDLVRADDPAQRFADFSRLLPAAVPLWDRS